MSRDNPETIDAPIYTHTQGNGSNIGSVSTGIVALSILSHSEDSIGPMTESSGIDAASLSDSRSGTEIPEMLPSLLDRSGHDILEGGAAPSDHRRRGSH